MLPGSHSEPFNCKYHAVFTAKQLRVSDSGVIMVSLKTKFEGVSSIVVLWCLKTCRVSIAANHFTAEGKAVRSPSELGVCMGRVSITAMRNKS